MSRVVSVAVAIGLVMFGVFLGMVWFGGSPPVSALPITASVDETEGVLNQYLDQVSFAAEKNSWGLSQKPHGAIKEKLVSVDATTLLLAMVRVNSRNWDVLERSRIILEHYKTYPSRASSSEITELYIGALLAMRRLGFGFIEENLGDNIPHDGTLRGLWWGLPELEGLHESAMKSRQRFLIGSLREAKLPTARLEEAWSELSGSFFQVPKGDLLSDEEWDDFERRYSSKQ